MAELFKKTLHKELPREFPKNLMWRILGIKKIEGKSLNCLGTQPSVKSSSQN